jgi:hypothetical protein
MFLNPAENHRFGTRIGHQTERSQGKNARGGARKPTQHDSDRVRTGFGVFRPRSKTLKVRDSQTETKVVVTGLAQVPTGCTASDNLQPVMELHRVLEQCMGPSAPAVQ